MFKKVINYKQLAIFYIFFLLFFRAGLLGKGAFAFPDESRYGYSIYALDCLRNHEPRGFVANLFATQARPGDAVIYLVPATVQGIFYQVLGWDPRLPASLIIPQLFNLVVGALILIVFYQVSLLVLESTSASFAATLVYGLLVNSNIYLRHILPYDAALLLMLAGVWYLLASRKRSGYISIKTSAVAALLATASFLTYPGYYFAPVLIGGLLWFKCRGAHSSAPVLKSFAVYVSSVILLLGLTELAAKIGGVSYFYNAAGLSTTIDQGSFEEGLSFGLKYLVQTERLAGIFLLSGTAAYTVIKSRDFLKTGLSGILNDDIYMLLSLSVIGYLAHSFMTVVMHRMVFYGRILHLFMPFWIWPAIRIVASIRVREIKITAYALVLSISLFSFAGFYFQYQKLAYPRDVLYRYNIFWEALPPSMAVFEKLPAKRVIAPPSPRINGLDISRLVADLTVVNGGYFYPVDGRYNPFIPPAGARMLFSGQHFLNFPAYLFEGFKMEERQHLQNQRINITVYK
jgi:hypothetical protein